MFLMLQVLELPDDFYPTDMHWMPRGGGGAPGTFQAVNTKSRLKTESRLKMGGSYKMCCVRQEGWWGVGSLPVDLGHWATAAGRFPTYLCHHKSTKGSTNIHFSSVLPFCLSL